MRKGEPSKAYWATELKALGFKRRSSGGRNGIYADRSCGPTTQAVGVLISDARSGAINIQLNINMLLPHADPPHQVVILEGDVGPEGVTIIEPWVHDPTATTWWEEQDQAAARNALASHGIGWFESFSTTESLVSYFEAEYTRYETSWPPQRSWSRRLWEKLRSGTSLATPAHYQYLLWLAMLYEAMGRIEVARERLTDYAEEVRRRGIKSEVARLERHMQALHARVV